MRFSADECKGQESNRPNRARSKDPDRAGSRSHSLLGCRGGLWTIKGTLLAPHPSPKKTPTLENKIHADKDFSYSGKAGLSWTSQMRNGKPISAHCVQARSKRTYFELTKFRPRIRFFCAKAAKNGACHPTLVGTENATETAHSPGSSTDDPSQEKRAANNVCITYTHVLQGGDWGMGRERRALKCPSNGPH